MSDGSHVHNNSFTCIVSLDAQQQRELRAAKAWSFAAMVLAIAALIISATGCALECGGSHEGRPNSPEWPEALVWVTIAVCWTAYAIVKRVQDRRRK